MERDGRSETETNEERGMKKSSYIRKMEQSASANGAEQMPVTPSK